MHFDEWTQGNDAGSQVAPVRKLVIHTTEGSSIEGAVGAYRQNNSWPHETDDYRTGITPRACGHLTPDRAARSLKNRSGGPETNRDGVYQIEVVGFAQQPEGINWARFGRERVGPLCRELGIPLTSTVVWVAYPSSYGENASQRLPGSAWDVYEGLLGHQHVPENDHGDPGAIPIQEILAAAALEEEDMPLNESDLNAIRSIMLDFQRLPTFWAASDNPGRENHWYKVGVGPEKVLVDKDQAQAQVDNGLAEWSGTSSQDPDGRGWAAEVPQHQLNGFETVGSDFYPWEDDYPGVLPVQTDPPEE
jgi:hypothetical protein